MHLFSAAWKDLEEEDEFKFLMEGEEDESTEDEGEISEEEEDLKREIAAEEAPPKKRQRNMKDITPILQAAARVGTTEGQAIAIANATREVDGTDLKSNPSEILCRGKFHGSNDRYLSRLSKEAVPAIKAMFPDWKEMPTTSAGRMKL